MSHSGKTDTKNFFFFKGFLRQNRINHDNLDNDSEGSGSNNDDVEGDEDSEEDPNQVGWVKGRVFEGVDTTEAFEEHFQARPTRNASGDRTGLQCSPNSVNSPAKAWRQIFTHAILDKIVTYTNQYGAKKYKDWGDIDWQDLCDFVCILFISKS